MLRTLQEYNCVGGCTPDRYYVRGNVGGSREAAPVIGARACCFCDVKSPGKVLLEGHHVVEGIS